MKTPKIIIQHGLSGAQAANLRELITAHVVAQVAKSWKGAGDPLDVPVVAARAVLAEVELTHYINVLIREGQ